MRTDDPLLSCTVAWAGKQEELEEPQDHTPVADEDPVTTTQAAAQSAAAVLVFGQLPLKVAVQVAEPATPEEQAPVAVLTVTPKSVERYEVVQVVPVQIVHWVVPAGEPGQLQEAA